MSSAVQDPPAETSVGPAFFHEAMPIEQIRRSPLNPRKHFDQAGLVELATSIKEVGIIEPLVVRPMGDHYEIVAGERRWRASQIAELTTLPVSVKSLTDDQALEIMVVENNQRENVSALEEADGFTRLLKSGYDLERLADRLGRSKKYVYDRLKLMDLVPAAKQLLAEDRITAGHAILLARQKPKDQARAVDPETGGLFDWDETVDHAAASESRKKDPYAGLALVSVRSFNQWLDDHVRIDLAKPVEAELFPDAALALSAERADRVVSISYEYHIDAELKKGSAAGDTILLSGEWKRADGTTGRDPQLGRDVVFKECPLSLLGVVVLGRDRGAAFRVCVEKSCNIHWKKERAEQSRTTSAGGLTPAQKQRQEDEQRKWKARQSRETEERSAYSRGRVPILTAFATKVKAANWLALSEAVDHGLQLHPKALALLGKPKNADELLRVIALSAVADVLFNEWGAPMNAPKWAARFGVDLKPLLKPDKPAVQTSAPKAKSAAKKKR